MSEIKMSEVVAAEKQPITAKQLREALAGVPDDTHIVMSSDAEGNAHGPLAWAGIALYAAECDWAGEVYPDHDQIGTDVWTEEDRAPQDAFEVVLLVPAG